jgi:hypothetical protein
MNLKGLIFNHEIWLLCQNCGQYYDRRLSNICDLCKHHNKDEEWT